MDDAGDPENVAPKKGPKKRLSVERIYQKKTQLEHILLRPDSYIGSAQPVTEKMWVFDEESGGIVNKEITYVPGLYKIFDEILVNAADNKQRDKKMDTIRVDINPDINQIKIYNNGKGIPVVHHEKENMYVPTMIFGHLLTSSNFDDEEEKVTGGRNGYGAKLCNVFSTKFTLETACKEYKKEFKQSWGPNMSKAGDPKVKEYGGEDFTRVTFQPDLAKFNMQSLDKDTVALLSRRAYDVAASARGVKVYLNGKRIPIKSFKDYIDFYIKGHEDETGNQIKALHEVCSERWEVAVAVSDNGFRQMSFVNSIATTKGGRHVEHVSKLLENSLTEILKKKNKSGVTIKPHQIRNHLWVFVNCLIVNPTFDSQTKENMTLQVNQFGSKCSLSEKFKTGLGKCGIVESVLAWSKFKQDQQLKSKHTAKKTNKLKGIAKLEDANDAGTRNSLDCTLILTEGDSAKTLAVAGLSVVGRDKFGIYPLRGKVLNVREASHKQIMDNKEINDLVKIVGLQYKKKYSTVDDLKTLRYGRVMIMTDQDQDGSHIKGLLINFFHHNWSGLLRLPFVEEFITPIVKATKGSNVVTFFSLPEFSEWKGKTDNWHTYKIKYYKGLGTSTSKEAKEYFGDMLRHRIKFHYNNEQDDYAINLAFSKKEIEQRKDWLKGWMEECKRRRELGLSEVYLYEKNTRSVSYSDFVNKELVLFSNLDNERSIPSLVDGFKPGQRKVMYTCIRRNDKREVKVAQLAGAVGEMSAYHHGEVSLMGTIINLAHDFVGSNNINLLLPIGQFGTRLAGGKDSASPRYIFTQMSPLTRHIFNPNDDAILNYLQDDNKKIEPEFYVPIIPMVLVNGADGIGTGWSTKIPNFDPREIVQNLLALLDGKEVSDLRPMVPWFKGFSGTIETIDNQRYVVSGELAEISDNKVEINELPVRTWTQPYKELVMEVYLNGSEKTAPVIQDYKEYHTDKTVKFVVQMAAEKMRQVAAEKGLHTFFKLQTTISTSSMVLFDHLGALKKFDDVLDILKEFYDIRLDYYAKRKAHLEGILGAEALRLSNQARFIIEKCDGSLVVENKKKKVMIAELQRRNYDPDPVKKWKKSLEARGDDQSDADGGSGGEEGEEAKGTDYDYLLGMAMWSLTAEKKDELLRKKQEKHQELEVVRRTSKKDMWRHDLKEFLSKLEEFEREEKEEDMAAIRKAASKKDRGGKKAQKTNEVLPSPHGIRVAPVIPDDMRKKAAQAAAAKGKKEGKTTARKLTDASEEKDEFDLMIDDKEHNRSLSEKLGLGETKKTEKRKTAKKAAAAPAVSKKDKRNPWESASDSDSDAGSASDFGKGGGDVDFDISDYGTPARDRPGRDRKKVNYNIGKSSSSGDSGSDDLEEMHENRGVKEGEDHSSKPPASKKNGAVDDDDDVKVIPPKKRALEIKSGDDSDSDFCATSKKRSAPNSLLAAAAVGEVKSSPGSGGEDNDSKFDSLFGSSSKDNGDARNGDSAAAAAAAGKKKKKNDGKRNAFDSESDDGVQESKPLQPPKKKAAKYKDSDSDFDGNGGDCSDDEDFAPAKPAKGKGKKAAATTAKAAPAAKKAAPKAPAKKAAAAASSKPPPPAANKNLKCTFSDSDDDGGGTSDVVEASPPAAKVQPKKKPATKKLYSASLSDSDDGFLAKKKSSKAAPKKKATAASKKKSAFCSDSSAEEMDFSSIKDYAPAQDRPGRQKKAVNYNLGGDSDSGDEF